MRLTKSRSPSLQPNRTREESGPNGWGVLAVVVSVVLGVGTPAVAGAQVPAAAETQVVVHGQDSRPSYDWELGEALLELGGLDAPVPSRFSNIVGVAVIGDSMLVVGDGATSELRFFAMDSGDHRFTVGGEGQGPGEIEGLWDLFLSEKTLVAIDAASRTSRFGFDGELESTMPPPVSATGMRLQYSGFFGDGTVLTYAGEIPSLESGGSTVSMARLVRLGPDGEPEFLLEYPWTEFTRSGSAPRPLHVAFGPVLDLAVFDDRFCAGYPTSYTIDCFTPSGQPLTRIVREDWASREVTQDDRELFRDGVEAFAGPGASTIIENQEFAGEYPAFGRLVAAQSGELWVGPFVPERDRSQMRPTPHEPTTWSVYSPAGDWLAEVVLPERFDLMWVGADVLVGVIRDELDVERVAVLSLIP